MVQMRSVAEKATPALSGPSVCVFLLLIVLRVCCVWMTWC